MSTLLLKNANVVNSMVGKAFLTNVLIENDTIIGVGNRYKKADKIIDLKKKYLLPGLVDAHMHVESTMLKPSEFVKVALLHGTIACVIDPHEITNVAGEAGLKYMMHATRNMPIDFKIMLPSCVPATKFDISKGNFRAKDMEKYFQHSKHVVGLAEMMNYDGVVNDDPEVWAKLRLARKYNRRIDGHAPRLTGDPLVKYVRSGITTDHECTSYAEAIEKMSLGQWILVREGTAAKNLEALKGLLKYPTCQKCCFATDDCEVNDIIKHGHIDNIIRKAIKLGIDPYTAINVGTYNPCRCYFLAKQGAIMVDYKANLITVDNLKSFKVIDVFKDGKQVVKDGKLLINIKENNNPYKNEMLNSFKAPKLSLDSFKIKQKGIKKTRVIKIIPGNLITDEIILNVNYDKNNGIDLKRDILKIAVIDSHKGTGKIALGFVQGYKLKGGAYASTVAHDSHNLIVIGTNEKDMLKAATEILKMRGGDIIVKNNKVVASLPFAIGGLMSDKDYKTVAKEHENLQNKVTALGVNKDIAPFMNVAFLSLPVIPDLKITPKGLVDVKNFKLVDLIVK